MVLYNKVLWEVASVLYRTPAVTCHGGPESLGELTRLDRSHDQHTKKDANHVIKRALNSNPYCYIIMGNLLAHMNLEIKVTIVK